MKFDFVKIKEHIQNNYAAYFVAFVVVIIVLDILILDVTWITLGLLLLLFCLSCCHEFQLSISLVGRESTCSSLSAPNKQPIKWIPGEKFERSTQL